MAKIFAVVPVYNRLQYTLQCLKAFEKQSYKDYQVIIVDSKSTDGTVKTIKRDYPNTKVIVGTQDWWWTQATQAGIDWALKKAADDDFVLLMNNDCFFGKNYLKTLVDYSAKYRNHLIGSLCVSSRQRDVVVEAGIRFDWERGYVYAVTDAYSRQITAYKKINQIDNIDALPGKGTLIPVHVIRKIGGFAVARLPHYIADYEFTNRAKRNGYELIVATRARVIHHWEATGDYFKGQDLGIKAIVNLLFGRKSMNNLVDWYHFVILACPKPLILWNFYLLIRRIWRMGLELPQLALLKKLIGYIVKAKAVLLRPAVVVYKKLNKI